MKNRRPKHRSLLARGRDRPSVLDLQLNASGTLQHVIASHADDPDQALWFLGLIAWAKSDENDPQYGGQCPVCVEWPAADVPMCSLCKGIGRIRIRLTGLPVPITQPCVDR
jgi:hypothetical protein